MHKKHKTHTSEQKQKRRIFTRIKTSKVRKVSCSLICIFFIFMLFLLFLCVKQKWQHFYVHKNIQGEENRLFDVLCFLCFLCFVFLFVLVKFSFSPSSYTEKMRWGQSWAEVLLSIFAWLYIIVCADVQKYHKMFS